MWYDTKRLFADADARIIVRALWRKEDYRQAGSTLFCRCPSGHKETHIDHCAVYQDGCKCFSCGARFGLREMVESYYEGKTFPEICGMIADVLGGREFYMTDKSSPARKKVQLPFTMSELETIGIYSPENVAGVPKMSVFYEDEPKTCILFIKRRAKEYLERYDYLRANETNNDLREEFERRYRLTKQLLERLGEKIETAQRLFKL